MINRVLTSCIIVFCAAFLFSVSSLADTKKEIAQRIQPIGKVNVAYDDGQATKKTIEKKHPQKKKHSGRLARGKEIYDTHCALCHNAGVAGAPRIGDIKAWQARLAQKQNVILKNIKKGLRMMPAGGTCQKCSDDDFLAVIDYIKKANKQKS